jgi:hypothetical protein
MSNVLIVVDVEADGPAPGLYSMLSFGAVVVDAGLTRRFESGPLMALTGAHCNPEAVNAIGMKWEDYITTHHTGGLPPYEVMRDFKKWIDAVSGGRHPIFISDNNGFDWMYICWYFWKYLGENPFGYSSRRIGDLYCGLTGDMRARWKHLRKTAHTHNPVDDAVGNAEALLYMINNMNLKV